MGICRVPEEPGFDPVEKRTSGDDEDQKSTTMPYSSISLVSWPNALDFNKLKSEETDGKDYAGVCLHYMLNMVQAGLRLTDAEITPMEYLTSLTRGSLTIQAEKAPVVGVPFPGLECVRHTAEFDVDAKTLFDMYVRLSYTEAIDSYTYLVEMLEEIDTAGKFSWAHVAYTADKIIPLFAHRDFVTFDFVDEENLILVSRSCLHPGRPQTPVPTCLHGLIGTCSKRPSRTLRSPLCYFLRVVPLGENKCRILQFQYSDLGGIFSPTEQTKGVVKFGLDNLERLYHLAQKIQSSGLKVGPKTPDYLSNPLLPKWRQAVDEMIPGL
mmetsp:Transcript_5343/g.11725  ORF Transcript_5343/g.11725 Transcript_5343/m.11725 type:complete len:324 (-) Transcript_5343:321-1292(-)